ncbi:MAG: hypothetical protein QOG03_1097, partial [Actinomycetota bacterium]|nr:hypothetical protein [Actinomycetota bacterium]
MTRRLLVALSAMLIAAPAALVAAAAQPSPSSVLNIPTQQVAPTMTQMAQVFGNSFNVAKPPAGQTPEERAQWL